MTTQTLKCARAVISAGLALLLAVSLLPFVPATAAAQTPSATRAAAAASSLAASAAAPLPESEPSAANLVLVVRCADSTAGDTVDGAPTGLNAIDDSGTRRKTKWQSLMEEMDSFAPEGDRSFRNFLYKASGGQCNVKSYFPQDNGDGTVAYLTVKRAYSDYVTEGSGFWNDGAFMADVAEAFNAAHLDFDVSVLDKRGLRSQKADGYIDNVQVVVEVPDGTDFTSHQCSVNGSENIALDGLLVGLCTMLPATYWHSSLGTGGSVAAHEFLHTMGAVDLYRAKGVGGSSEPVSCWDVMASGVFYSWPLAITRELVGWARIPALSVGEDGAELECTLYDLSESDQTEGSVNPLRPQAVKIKLPASSEYFVVEYRKGDILSGGYDRKVGGSGVIVYRVNDGLVTEGNYKGRDYVYVFRPTAECDTSATSDDHASVNNDPMRGLLATGRYRQSISGRLLNSSAGTSDLSAGLDDGALVYSSGENSGLVVEVVDQSDSSATIKVKVPKTSWSEVLGDDGTRPVAAESGEPQLLAEDGDEGFYLLGGSGAGSAQLWHFDGHRWAPAGRPMANIVRGDLLRVNGALYLSCIESGSSTDRFVVKQFDGTTWRDTASTTAPKGARCSALSVVGGKLYAVAPVANGALQVYQVGEGRLSAVGDALPAVSVQVAELMDLAGRPAVAVSDFGTIAAGASTKLFSWTGSSWSARSLPAGASSQLSSAVLDGRTYLYVGVSSYPSTAQLLELSPDGSALREISLGDKIGAAPYSGTLAAGSSRLYLAYASSGGMETAVYALDADNFTVARIGDSVYRNGQGAVVLPIKNGLVCAVEDFASANAIVRRYALSAGDGETPPTLEADIPSSGESPGEGSQAGSGSSVQQGSGGGGSGSSSSAAVKPTTSKPAASSATKKPASKKTVVKKPAATKVTSLKRGRRAFTLAWKKVSGATGYEIQYSTSKKFAKKITKKKLVKKAKTTRATIKKLKAKKAYYVRVRTYKKVSGKTYYSAWTKAKKVKTR